MEYIKKIEQMIDNKKNNYINISNKIWDYAELSYEERKYSNLFGEVLESEGFEVTKNVESIKTASIGSFGKSEYIIAFLGEYDALANLSQEKNATEYKPITKNGNGHGCGHNLLGTGALAAAIAVKDYIVENNLSGTIRFYGCPAEESGDGKTYMAREGLFDDVDFALTWHPKSVNAVSIMNALATYQVYFRFKGTSSHASISPHLGRSALDAVEIMNVGVNYLREHIIPEARVHYAVTNTGGSAPNVVQSEAEVMYLMRAPEVKEVEKIYERIKKIAEGASLITETKVEIEFDSGTSNLIKNETIDKVMIENFKKLGTPKFTLDEVNFAKRIQQTIPEDNKEDLMDNSLKGATLAEDILPLSIDEKSSGSTDVADVSWITPTSQVHTACMAIGTSLHSWQAVSQVGTSIGHKGMIHASKVLATTAVDMLQNKNLIEDAQK